MCVPPQGGEKYEEKSNKSGMVSRGQKASEPGAGRQLPLKADYWPSLANGRCPAAPLRFRRPTGKVPRPAARLAMKPELALGASPTGSPLSPRQIARWQRWSRAGIRPAPFLRLSWFPLCLSSERTLLSQRFCAHLPGSQLPMGLFLPFGIHWAHVLLLLGGGGGRPPTLATEAAGKQLPPCVRVKS